MYIISPLRSGEEQITAAINRVHQTITNLGGEVTTAEHGPPWGRRKFAYPLREYTEGEASRRSFTEGYYVITRCQLGTRQIPELERLLKLNDTVLRYLLTVVEAKGAVAPLIVPDIDVDDADDSEDIDLEDEETDDAL
jgi:small subunit ribosomal protein S6